MLYVSKAYVICGGPSGPPLEAAYEQSCLHPGGWSASFTAILCELTGNLTSGRISVPLHCFHHHDVGAES